MRVRQFASSDAGGVTRSITMNEVDGNAWIYIKCGQRLVTSASP